VHDLVDFVTEEARRCAERAAVYLKGGPRETMLPVNAGANVRCVVPNACAPGRENVFYMRSLVVKNDALLVVRVGGQEIRTKRLAHVQPSEMIRFALEPRVFREPLSASDAVEVAIQ
jgi:hypothetical protein